MKQTKARFMSYLRRFASYTLLASFIVPCFLLDLIMFFLSSKDTCLNCGIKEIVKQGIFTEILIKKVQK